MEQIVFLNASLYVERIDACWLIKFLKHLENWKNILQFLSQTRLGTGVKLTLSNICAIISQRQDQAPRLPSRWKCAHRLTLLKWQRNDTDQWRRKWRSIIGEGLRIDCRENRLRQSDVCRRADLASQGTLRCMLLRAWKESQDRAKAYLGDAYYDYNLVLTLDNGRLCEDRVIGNAFNRLKRNADLLNGPANANVSG